MTQQLDIQTKLSEIQGFESAYQYDTTYMKEMLAASPAAYEVFERFLPMASFRQHANPEVYFTAKLTAFRMVDCGPCLQLAVRMAREGGLDSERIRNVLDASKALSPELEMVRTFVRAILTGEADPNPLRSEIEKAYGLETVVEIALVAASAQVFPVVKRAMGHYQSCATVAIEV